jgi:Chlorophyll A-B binding protein
MTAGVSNNQPLPERNTTYAHRQTCGTRPGFSIEVQCFARFANLDNSLHKSRNIVTLFNVGTSHNRLVTMENTTQVQTENRNAWVFGFTPQAEIWNGRLAMIGFLAVILTEVFSNEGVLHFWGLL